jgi:hypothetical protein
MKIKRGATIKGLDIRMRSLLQAAERVWQRHNATSGLGGAAENMQYLE